MSHPPTHPRCPLSPNSHSVLCKILSFCLFFVVAFLRICLLKITSSSSSPDRWTNLATATKTERVTCVIVFSQLLADHQQTPMSGTTSDRLRRQKRRHADDGGEPCRPLKLVLLGDSKVGTTSLIHRFIYGTFNERVERTITVDEMEKKVCRKATLVKGTLNEHVDRTITIDETEKKVCSKAALVKGTRQDYQY